MNKQRRKQLEKLNEQLDALSLDVEMLKDDETGSFEALPESLQQGERGQAMEAAIDALSSAFDSIEDARNYIGEAINS